MNRLFLRFLMRIEGDCKLVARLVRRSSIAHSRIELIYVLCDTTRRGSRRAPKDAFVVARIPSVLRHASRSNGI